MYQKPEIISLGKADALIQSLGKKNDQEGGGQGFGLSTDVDE